MDKEVLIFEIFSEYGHFRKFNTTTSPLTFSIPPRTALVGLIGAILGVEREIGDSKYPPGVTPVNELLSKENCDIAVQIINPIVKVNIAFNLVNTKNSFYNLTKAGRTQIAYELLKNPRYRIYFACGDKNIFDELERRLRQKCFHFNPYFGLSQFTSNVDESRVDRKTAFYRKNDKNELIEIVTAINMSKIEAEKPIKFEQNAFYSLNNMPVVMTRCREVMEYSDILIEKTGKPIKVKVPDYYEVDGYGNILFL